MLIKTTSSIFVSLSSGFAGRKITGGNVIYCTPEAGGAVGFLSSPQSQPVCFEKCLLNPIPAALLSTVHFYLTGVTDLTGGLVGAIED